MKAPDQRLSLVSVGDLPDEVSLDDIEAVFVQYVTSDGEQELECPVVKA